MEEEIKRAACVVGGRAYTYLQGYQKDDAARAALNKLARETFGISFEAWYRAGFWSDGTSPLSLMEEGNIVANVMMNRMRFTAGGVPVRAVQLGTVMTAAGSRGRGLARFLMERALQEAGAQPVYLFANDSAAAFYPKFGFVRAAEYVQTRTELPPRRANPARRLNLEDPGDLLLLRRASGWPNPFSSFAREGNAAVFLFHCLNGMENHLYYAQDLEALIAARHENGMMFCDEILCTGDARLCDILGAVREESDAAAEFGFTLRDGADCAERVLKEDDSTLFVLERSGSPLGNRRARFPALSHT